MASTFSDLKFELIGTGDQSGTWGITTNDNIGVAIEEAITGSADVTFASADVTVTLTDTVAAQTARNLRLNLTGTTGGARNLILGSGCQIEKLYLINNGTADTITVKNTTGTGIAVPAGKSMFVYNDATNVVDATTHLSSLTLGTDLAVADGGTGLSSGTSGGIPYFSSTTAMSSSAALAANAIVIGGGAGVAPSTTTTGTGVVTAIGNNTNSANGLPVLNGSGNLGVAQGGTGAGTLTANNVILGNGTSAVQFVAPGTTGNILTSNGTTWTSAVPAPGGIEYVVKTTNYTTQDKEGVLADTSGGSFTVTLPATPSTGAQVVVADPTGDWGANNLTIGRNGSTIAGVAQDLICDISGASVQLVYDGTTWAVYAQVGGNGGVVAVTNASNVFTAAQTFQAANAIRSEAASTQDAVVIAGRAGGTNSYAVTITPTTLSANRTLTIPDASGTILQSGTAVTVAQGGTGATTLTANNVILGNGTSAVQFVAPGSSGNVLTSNGTTWTSATPAGAANVQTFSSSGTWTKPTGAQFVFVDLWGAGGGGAGGTNNGNYGATGGGGGARKQGWFLASQLSATETVTIGAGGTGGAGSASATGNNGIDGGNTTFGSKLTAYGGGGGVGNTGGANTNTGGGGGGTGSKGDSGVAGTTTGVYGGVPGNAAGQNDRPVGNRQNGTGYTLGGVGGAGAGSGSASASGEYGGGSGGSYGSFGNNAGGGSIHGGGGGGAGSGASGAPGRAGGGTETYATGTGAAINTNGTQSANGSGTGGGGGSSIFGNPGGNGGNGGGGGGGGGYGSGVTGGKGGNGGNGYAIIYTW